MRKDEDPDDEPDLDARFELDAEALTRGRQGRCGWFREGRRQLDEHREQEARPVARSRTDRLEDAKRRLEEQLAVELAANQAYETYRRTGRDTTGRRVGGGTKPYDTPVLPEGRVNLTDPDSRLMRTQGQPTLQGYNAQAAVTAEQIIVAAETAIESPDFGHLEPMFNAAMRDLVLAGVNERPGTPLADAGYWHELQMESIVAGGTQVLVPPDSSLKEQPRAGWTGGLYDHMRRVLLSEHGQAIYRQRQQTIEPVFGHTKYNRKIDRFQRRGRAAALSEWRLITATHNLLKLHSHWISAATG